jgi:hypothetical protein
MSYSFIVFSLSAFYPEIVLSLINLLQPYYQNGQARISQDIASHTAKDGTTQTTPTMGGNRNGPDAPIDTNLLDI